MEKLSRCLNLTAEAYFVCTTSWYDNNENKDWLNQWKTWLRQWSIEKEVRVCLIQWLALFSHWHYMAKQPLYKIAWKLLEHILFACRLFVKLGECNAFQWLSGKILSHTNSHMMLSNAIGANVFFTGQDEYPVSYNNIIYTQSSSFTWHGKFYALWNSDRVCI